MKNSSNMCTMNVWTSTRMISAARVGDPSRMVLGSVGCPIRWTCRGMPCRRVPGDWRVCLPVLAPE